MNRNTLKFVVAGCGLGALLIVLALISSQKTAQKNSDFFADLDKTHPARKGRIVIDGFVSDYLAASSL